MSNLKGFLSYARADNTAERGRIKLLAEHIKQEYQLITGDEIELFVDEEDIEKGEDWEKAIDTNLSDVAFFVPVITPTYFQRPECRRELQTFLGRAEENGLSALILPIYYADVRGMRNGTSNDDLILRTNRLQAFDWQQLRFADITSSEYRRAIAEIVERLVRANIILETPQLPEIGNTEIVTHNEIDNSPGQMETISPIEIDDSPGQLEIFADLEVRLEKVPVTLSSIAEEMRVISEHTNKATQDMLATDKQPRASSRKVLIASNLSTQLAPSIDKIWSSANSLSEDLIYVDRGYRVLFERITNDTNMSLETRQQVCQLFSSVKTLVTNSLKANANIREMKGAINKVSELSRTLRPVLGQLISGLNVILDTQHYYSEWLEQIERTGISCD